METPSSAIPPSSPSIAPQVFNKLKAILNEHFDDHLLVVSKDGDVYSFYKAKCSAYGMASMVCQDINSDWHINRSNKI